MRPVCFVVMPFRRKSVTSAHDEAPSELDCDRLWDMVYRPVLEKLEYIPVRADIESSSVVVKDMLNRLKHADLVLADVSLPNGNVYYELGIRHVAQKTCCVQVAAEWFKPLFDVNGFRTITFPLQSGEVPDAEVPGIRSILSEAIPRYAVSRTPYHVLVDEKREDAFEDEARRMAAFQAELSEVRLVPPGRVRAQRVEEVARDYGDAAKGAPDVALELLFLLRDAKNWVAVREFVESCPDTIRETEPIQEQYFLALSELGHHEKGIGGVCQMIRRFGATPERYGLLGGRYKRLYQAVRKEREEEGKKMPCPREREHLEAAIAAYEQGMDLDLNEYYCSCNLPALYRFRGKEGDEDLASSVDTLVLRACRRAMERGSRDPYLPYTLFGAAFRSGNVVALEEIVDEIEGGAAWRLDTTLNDAQSWLEQAPRKKKKLRKLLDRLRGALDAKS